MVKVAVARGQYQAAGWLTSGLTVDGTYENREWDDLCVAQLRRGGEFHIRFTGRSATYLGLQHAGTAMDGVFQTRIDVTVNGKPLVTALDVPGHRMPSGRANNAVLPRTQSWPIDRLLGDGLNVITIRLADSSPTVYWLKSVFLQVPKTSPIHPKPAEQANSKGIRPVAVTDREGRPVTLYEGSHALLIGVSDYTAGWPDLESIPSELAEIEKALAKRGFEVERVMNPDGRMLRDAYQSFIARHGYESGNRLLFFFSGHGCSRRSNTKGYLVPTDAPDPGTDEKGFLRKALPMSQILAWSRQMEATHALFLFDSCFSGTIFKTRALPKAPPHISHATAKPVRQFISAGGAGQEVPAKSVFVTCFLRGLEGAADLTKDGYIAGSELGIHLRERMHHYDTGQIPQYGKIRDPELDEGDFIFRLEHSE